MKQKRKINVNSFIFKNQGFRNMYYRIPSSNSHGDLLICKTGSQGEIYNELKKRNNQRLNWLVLLELSFNNKDVYARELEVQTGNLYTINHSSVTDISKLSLQYL